MTRINCFISPKNLTDEHLLAEHREIKRLPSCLKKAIKSGSTDKIPKKFVLGKGHVLFFLDKMLYIKNRYVELYNECINRGFNVQSYLSNFNDIDSKYMNDYEQNFDAFSLAFRRILDKILEGKKEFYHYKSKRISKPDAMSLLATPEFMLEK